MSDYLSVFISPQGETETLRAYQTVLDHWPVPFTELDVQTSFGQTHIIAGGPDDAPPVILLHAYFATAMSWYRTVASLSQHYRVYAVDMLGEANRSCPCRPITSLEDSLRWFTELLNKLEVETVYLVGNSFGGFVAAYYAMHLSERVRRLVLIGPAATFRGMLPFYLHLFVPKALYLFFPWLPGRQRLMRGAINWMHADLPGDPLWEPLFYRVMLYGSTRVQIFPKVYSAAELAQIKAPTLLLLGEQEKVYPPRDAARQARRLMPAIQVEFIPLAHHLTALAQPELVNERLVRFFEEASEPQLARVGQT